VKEQLGTFTEIGLLASVIALLRQSTTRAVIDGTQEEALAISEAAQTVLNEAI
jgi:hypothetical protein